MSAEIVEITVPRSKRIKAAALGFALAGVCAAYIAFAREAEVMAWFVLAFLLAAAAANTLLIFRPISLVLDKDGFGFVGGFRSPSRPRRLGWNQVDGFIVVAIPGLRGRTNKYVGVKMRPGVDDPGPVGRLLAGTLGTDRYLPMTWPKSPETMVDELNAYRHRFLASSQAA